MQLALKIFTASNVRPEGHAQLFFQIQYKVAKQRQQRKAVGLANVILPTVIVFVQRISSQIIKCKLEISMFGKLKRTAYYVEHVVFKFYILEVY